jgi:DNA repair protein RecO (recombination protein O)
MQIKTKAIVLTSIKYGEADLITKCLTEEGVKSYMLRSVLRSGSKKLKPGYFQPLSQLEITAVHNKKGNLNRMTEARVSYLYRTIGFNVYKQSIAQFLAEVLSRSLREEERNDPQFQYIENSLQWLDTHDRFADFHLLFLLELTKFLGFYPDVTNIVNNHFDLEEGIFTKYQPQRSFIGDPEITHFKLLIGTKFDDMERLKWNSAGRQYLLEKLLDYYELHVPGFKKPRSLKVLKEVFNEIN